MLSKILFLFHIPLHVIDHRVASYFLPPILDKNAGNNPVALMNNSFNRYVRSRPVCFEPTEESVAIASRGLSENLGKSVDLTKFNS